MEPAELVFNCNDLAREFYRVHGYTVRVNYPFYICRHPQERLMWALACTAYLELGAMEMEEVLTELLAGLDTGQKKERYNIMYSLKCSAEDCKEVWYLLEDKDGYPISDDRSWELINVGDIWKFYCPKCLKRMRDILRST